MHLIVAGLVDEATSTVKPQPQPPSKKRQTPKGPRLDAVVQGLVDEALAEREWHQRVPVVHLLSEKPLRQKHTPAPREISRKKNVHPLSKKLLRKNHKPALKETSSKTLSFQ